MRGYHHGNINHSHHAAAATEVRIIMLRVFTSYYNKGSILMVLIESGMLYVFLLVPNLSDKAEKPVEII